MCFDGGVAFCWFLRYNDQKEWLRYGLQDLQGKDKAGFWCAV